MVNNEKPLATPASSASMTPLVDVKRIVYRIIRYWYLVVASLAIALTVAFYNNRYTQRIYPISASIIVREKEETSGAELLYNNALINQYRNYLNEPYILRSYPLVVRAVEELNLMVAFYKEGRVITTEIYNSLPVKVSHLGVSGKTGNEYNFRLLDTTRFELSAKGGAQGATGVFLLGEKFNFDQHELLVERVPGIPFQEHLGQDYVMVLRSSLKVAGEYISKLNVKWAEKGAGIMNLSIVGANPTKEIDFVNSLIRNYQDYDLEKKNQTANRTVTFINGQLGHISDSLNMFERKLELFKTSNRTTGELGMDAQRVYTRIEALELQKAELLVRTNYYNYLDQYLKESKDLDQIILPGSMGINDPILVGLISKVIDLQLEIKLFIEKEKAVNPIVTSKMARLNELRQDVLESLRGLRSTDKIKMDFLNKQISDAERQLGLLPLAQRQYISIQRNYSLLENLYVYLMQKRAEAQISKAGNVSDLVTVNPPMQSGGAITPKVGQNYLIALFIGLAIPLAIFVVLEYLNTRVQSKQDIERFSTIPFIGGVGHKKGEVNLEVLRSPKSVIAESFRALRANLNYFIGKKEKSVILITSSISGEGKTFTSINLASVYSLSGKRTLIVGADMRKPKIYKDFGALNEKGLSTYLAGLHEFDEIVQKTEFENLFLISGGPVPPNPSELILQPRMDKFIEQAREQFDCVVIDTPPVALITDAFPLMEYIDHTLFLVRQNYTPKELLKVSQDYYASGKLKNISIVFNDVYRSGPGYGYGYGYQYGYAYGGYGYRYGRKKENEEYYS